MRTIAFTFASLLVGQLFVGAAAAADFDRNLTFEQIQTVEALSPHPGGLIVTAKLDRADATYVDGETVHLSLTSNKTAYIAVIDVGPTGDISLLYPNTVQTESRLEPGKTLEIPPASATNARIRVSAPFGIELVTVIASDKPLELFEGKDLTQAGTFSTVKGGMNTFINSAKEFAKQPKGDRALSVIVLKLQTMATRPAKPLPPGETLVNGQPTSASATTTVAAAPSLTVPQIANAYDFKLLLDKASYQPGERPTLKAEVGRVCYLSVFMIGADSRAWMIYPNKYQPRSLVNSGLPVIVVGATASAQLDLGAGVTRFVGVCSTEETPVAKADRKDNDVFGEVGTAEALAQALTEAAKRPPGSTVMALVSNPSGS